MSLLHEASISNILSRMKGEKVYIRRQKEALSPIKVSKKNIETILRFDNSVKAQGMKSTSRLVYWNFFVNLCEFNGSKPFDKFTKEDIENLIVFLGRPGGRRKKALSEGSINREKIRIKRFFKYIHGDEEYPPCVKWIKPKSDNGDSFVASDILTPQEIKSLIKHSVNIRDKALIHVAYESAARHGELERMKVKNVMFQDDGTALLSIPVSKTKPRTVLLIDSAPVLKEYLNNNHPYSDNPDYTLWISHNRKEFCKPLRYSSYCTILNRSAKLAGIKKRVYFHLLRKSRTHECAKFMTDQELKQFAGWTRSSKMAEVYTRITPEDVMNKQKERAGIKRPEEVKKERSVLSPVKCICGHKNSISNVVCAKCARALTLEEKMKEEKKDEVIELIMGNVLKKNPKLKKVIDATAREMKEELSEIVKERKNG